MTSRMALRLISLSRAVIRGWSSGAISVERFLSLCRTVRRRASVGWAVSTGSTRACRRIVARRSALMPDERISATACLMLSDRGVSPDSNSRTRSIRRRCRSSARLTRWKYAVKALTTRWASGSERDLARASSASPVRTIALSAPVSVAARKLRARPRNSSTRS